MRPDFKLYLITDRKQCDGRGLIEALEQALSAGVKAVQVREKDLPGKDLLELAFQLRALTAKHKARLLVNDRLDVAMASGADGIHCPEEGVNPRDARTAGFDKLVGASVHTLESALRTERDGADFVAFGPIFSTPSKEGILEPRGLEKLAEVCRGITIPVFAIGGITPQNAELCLKSGASGIAAISAILKSENIKQTMSDFRKALGAL